MIIDYHCSRCLPDPDPQCRACRFRRCLRMLERHESRAMDDTDDRIVLADALEDFIHKELASNGL